MSWKFWKKKKEKELKPFPVLFEQTQELIRSIRTNVQGDFMTYWTCEGSIDHDDPMIIRKLFSERPSSDHLQTFVRSYGGSGEASLRIIHLIRQLYDRMTALVPMECASAATMLVLGADLIKMGTLGCLSAVDTKFSHPVSPRNHNGFPIMVSQNELDRVIDLWERKRNTSNKNPYESLYEHIHPLVFGAVDRIRSLSIRITKEILTYHMRDHGKAAMISDYLNSGYPAHEYPITFKEAQRIGLPVDMMDAELEEQLVQLDALYSEMTQPVTQYGDNEIHERWIGTIIERSGVQYFYQKDQKFEFNYTLRRYLTKSEDNGWRKAEYNEDGEMVISKAFIK